MALQLILSMIALAPLAMAFVVGLPWFLTGFAVPELDEAEADRGGWFDRTVSLRAFRAGRRVRLVIARLTRASAEDR